MWRVNEFQKLLTGAFISQSGSHLLTLALSGLIFIKTQSPTMASLVFVFSFFPSVVIGPKIGAWVDAHISKKFLVQTEVLSILSTILCGIAMALEIPISFLCVVLGIRSVLLFTSRSASVKWLKISTENALQSQRLKLYYLSFFLSTAISGILAGHLLARNSVWVIVGLDVLTYLLGILVYLTLKPLQYSDIVVSKSEVVPLTETLKAIFGQPTARSPFLLVCVSQAIFQGAYSALVTFLPVKHFSLGAEAIGKFQIAASAGITLGFLLNWYSPSFLAGIKKSNFIRTLACCAIAAFALLTSVNTQSVVFGLSAFCLMNLAYEYVWLHGSSEFFKSAPAERTAEFQFTLSSVAAFLMSAITLIYSLAIERVGASVSVAVVLIGASLGVLFYFFIRPLAAASMMQGGEVR